MSFAPSLLTSYYILHLAKLKKKETDAITDKKFAVCYSDLFIEVLGIASERFVACVTGAKPVRVISGVQPSARLFTDCGDVTLSKFCIDVKGTVRRGKTMHLIIRASKFTDEEREKRKVIYKRCVNMFCLVIVASSQKKAVGDSDSDLVSFLTDSAFSIAGYISADDVLLRKREPDGSFRIPEYSLRPLSYYE
jgi:hypothetical protein